MIDDALRLSVDLLFPNEMERSNPYVSKFPVENYTNSENIFDFLGNINDK